MTAPAKSLKSSLLDAIAIGVSSVCVVHCIGLPLMLLAMPGLSQALNWPEEVHIIAVLMAIPASSLALLSRWRRLSASQRRLVAGLIVLGLSLLVAALFTHTEWQETVLTVIGSLMLISAHILNLRSPQAA